MSKEDKYIEIYNKLHFDSIPLSDEENKLIISEDYQRFEIDMNATKEQAYSEHLISKKLYLRSLEAKRRGESISILMRYGAIAASITIFIISYIFLKPQKDMPLQLDAYPNLETMRSDLPSNVNLKSAYKYYDQKNYKQAIKLFNNSIQPMTPEVNFYLGVSYLMESKYDEAKNILSELRNNGFNKYPVEYYLLIAYLNSNDHKNASEIFNSDLNHLPKIYLDKIELLKEKSFIQ